MTPAHTSEAEAFRAEVRETLARRLPAGWRGLGALDRDAAAAFIWQWRDVLRDEGLLAVSGPAKYGGGGRTALETRGRERSTRARHRYSATILGEQVLGLPREPRAN